MFGKSHFILSVLLLLLMAFGATRRVYATDDYGDSTRGSYPYYNRTMDAYFGVAIGNGADTTVGNLQADQIYNPIGGLVSISSHAFIGIRPSSNIMILKSMRFELEYQYRRSKYDIKKDVKKITIDQSFIPAYGEVDLRKVMMFNVYYDMNWIHDFIYPYVGYGFGKANIRMSAIDTRIQPNGLGQEYHGNKSGVQVSQLILGLQYDTKIIKSSMFVEYRYFSALGGIEAVPQYRGDESGGKDPIPLPPGYVYPTNKTFHYGSHSIVVGVKYYLY